MCAITMRRGFLHGSCERGYAHSTKPMIHLLRNKADQYVSWVRPTVFLCFFCTQVLRFWSTFFPASITGMLPARGPRLTWCSVCHANDDWNSQKPRPENLRVDAWHQKSVSSAYAMKQAVDCYWKWDSRHAECTNSTVASNECKGTGK